MENIRATVVLTLSSHGGKRLRHSQRVFLSNLRGCWDFRPALVANCVFNTFLCYTTIILNIVTIHAIRKTALLPKPLRTLLLSLAASDVGVGLLVQPLYISTLVSRLNQKRIDCISYKKLLAAINFFCISSLLNVVTISVDRFLAVHLHLRYQERATHKRVIAAVISIWLLSAIISSSVFWNPLFIISQVAGFVNMTVCLILLVIVYWRIYIVIKRHKIHWKSRLKAFKSKKYNREFKMATYQTFWSFESQLLEHFMYVLCSWFVICLPIFSLFYSWLAF